MRGVWCVRWCGGGVLAASQPGAQKGGTRAHAAPPARSLLSLSRRLSTKYTHRVVAWRRPGKSQQQIGDFRFRVLLLG